MGFDLILKPKDLRVMYRGLMMRGLSAGEASNIVAGIMGLAVNRTNWTLKELQQLDFIKWQDILSLPTAALSSIG